MDKIVLSEYNECKRYILDELIIKLKEKIEKEMDYPGQIKVNLVRETRVIDYAK